MSSGEEKAVLRELERLGWIYDPSTDRFRNDGRELTWNGVIGLVPGMTCDDLRDDER
jgi:hypothetical protein